MGSGAFAGAISIATMPHRFAAVQARLSILAHDAGFIGIETRCHDLFFAMHAFPATSAAAFAVRRISEMRPTIQTGLAAGASGARQCHRHAHPTALQVPTDL